MRAEFFCHAVAEVLRAQHRHLADTVCGQPPLGVHPVDPDRGSVELLDPLPERPQDCPHDRGLFSRRERCGPPARQAHGPPARGSP
jgi:hypothetical protein